MRSVLAILFSLVLVLGQSVSLPGAQTVSTADKRPCACPDCAKGTCCVAKKSSAPQQEPVAPAVSSAQEGLQLLIPQLVMLLDLPAVKPVDFPSRYSFVSKAAAVPLYEWNCSYLI